MSQVHGDNTKQNVYASALVFLLHLMPLLKHVILLLSQMHKGMNASWDFHGKSACLYEPRLLISMHPGVLLKRKQGHRRA